MRQANLTFPNIADDVFSVNTVLGIKDPAMIDLIKHLAAWPRVIETAVLALEPHRIGFYLHETAALFHALWNKGKENTQLRFIIPQDKPQTLAHLALLRAVALVLKSGFKILGVEPLEEMR
jgi:arginyl-tRNA synthetase